MISHMIWQLREQLIDEIEDFGVHLGYDGLCSTQNYVAQLNGSRDNYLKRYKNKLTVFELRNIVIWVPTDY